MRTRWFAAGFGVAGMLLGLWNGLVPQERDSVQRLNLPGRSDDRPYNHTIVAGRTVYVAGSIGVEPETGAVPADAMAEARIALDALESKLALAGATMDDLVSVQVFCSDLSLYGDFNKLYASYFEKTAPVRAFVGAGPLLFKARFEITGIAVLP
jgi:2-iminobutanoate/2-iminopropanoate deaminase